MSYSKELTKEIELIIKKENINYTIQEFKNKVDWDWMETQKVIEDKEFIKHIHLEKPLKIFVDGILSYS